MGPADRPRSSLAGLTCYRPGQRSRLIYRAMVHKGHKGEKKGFREADFAALVDAAHQQLAGPIVLVWDNLRGHVSAKMKALIAARPWLRVYTLPAYAAGNATNLARLAKTKLRKMQPLVTMISRP